MPRNGRRHFVGILPWVAKDDGCGAYIFYYTLHTFEPPTYKVLAKPGRNSISLALKTVNWSLYGAFVFFYWRPFVGFYNCVMFLRGFLSPRQTIKEKK